MACIQTYIHTYVCVCVCAFIIRFTLLPTILLRSTLCLFLLVFCSELERPRGFVLATRQFAKFVDVNVAVPVDVNLSVDAMVKLVDSRDLNVWMPF